MSASCTCEVPPKANKSKWKLFRLGKKKKKRSSEPTDSIPDPKLSMVDCPICAKTAAGFVQDRCMVDAYEEKQRMRAQAIREDPTYVEVDPEPPPKPVNTCGCTRCRRERGEDPLTVELLPMETQVTLQNTLQDTVLMCVIL